MPRSSSFNRKPIINEIFKLKSKNKLEILDLGIGCGNFGKLIKDSRINASIIGVEVWENYKNKKWEYYDKIVISEIISFLKKNKKKFDVVLLVDVLEHFNKRDGEIVLSEIKKITKRLSIISTPITKFSQDSYKNNLFEKHRYFWNERKLEDFGFKMIFSRWIPTFFIWKLWPFSWPLFSRLGVFVYNKNQ